MVLPPYILRTSMESFKQFFRGINLALKILMDPLKAEYHAALQEYDVAKVYLDELEQRILKATKKRKEYPITLSDSLLYDRYFAADIRLKEARKRFLNS